MEPRFESGASASQESGRPVYRGDEALPLAEVCRRFGVKRSTFYEREALGYWKAHGLIELPRLAVGRGKRLFSAASVDRVIRHGGSLRSAAASPRVRSHVTR